ncbi:hypothetical protein RUM43_004815 [Polyplax serrata]|uniref:Uncharacterized protein n=1 Tax=Polyplax serrata TaxID=468196 RepID=A0AAN8SE37_POLSC
MATYQLVILLSSCIRLITAGTTDVALPIEQFAPISVESVENQSDFVNDSLLKAVDLVWRFFSNETQKNQGEKDSIHRSYTVKNQEPKQQFWEDKPQLDDTPPFLNAKYHAFPFLQGYKHPGIHPFFPPQKKETSLLFKMLLYVLMKVIFAKVKALGLLKILFLVALKIPILLFKLLFVLKGIKLIAVPFLLTIAVPFILFGLALILPVLIPLLIPLFLLFFPMVPVPTRTGYFPNSRGRHLNHPLHPTWSDVQENWKRLEWDQSLNRRKD